MILTGLGVCKTPSRAGRKAAVPKDGVFAYQNTLL
jgi:hypothetical protein